MGKPYRDMTREEKEKQKICSQNWVRANREKVRARTRAWQKANPGKFRESARKWQRAHPEYVRNWHKEHPEGKRERELQRKYGISTQDYERMFVEQEGLCYICGKPDKRKLSVDHNHQTGRVRRLLCDRCNKVLGHMEDSPILLEKSAAYLRQFED